jgi:hypothetical protein
MRKRERKRERVCEEKLKPRQTREGGGVSARQTLPPQKDDFLLGPQVTVAKIYIFFNVFDKLLQRPSHKQKFVKPRLGQDDPTAQSAAKRA